jgi:hypothetical protein
MPPKSLSCIRVSKETHHRHGEWLYARNLPTGLIRRDVAGKYWKVSLKPYGGRTWQSYNGSLPYERTRATCIIL